MIASDTLTVKALGSTIPGELVRVVMAREEPAICIVLINEGDSVVLGALQPVEATPYPFHTAIKGGVRCISYGCDWFMRPEIGNESWSGNRSTLYWPGSLHLQTNGWIVTFRQTPKDYNHGELLFNLTTGALVDDITNSAPFRRWQIWESRELFLAKHPALLSIDAVDVNKISRF